MRNVDKYLTEIAQDSCLEIRKLRTGKGGCLNENCEDCMVSSIEWLEAEYKESEVDWDNVKIGTPIYVWNDDATFKRKAIFIKSLNPSCQYMFQAVTVDDGNVNWWKNAEIIEEVEE